MVCSLLEKPCFSLSVSVIIINRHYIFTHNMRMEADDCSILRECMIKNYEMYSLCQRLRTVCSFYIFTKEANVMTKGKLTTNDYLNVISLKLYQLCIVF
jgi:hypothetical protein